MIPVNSMVKSILPRAHEHVGPLGPTDHAGRNEFEGAERCGVDDCYPVFRSAHHSNPREEYGNAGIQEIEPFTFCSTCKDSAPVKQFFESWAGGPSSTCRSVASDSRRLPCAWLVRGAVESLPASAMELAGRLRNKPPRCRLRGCSPDVPTMAMVVRDVGIEVARREAEMALADGVAGRPSEAGASMWRM